MELNRNHYFTIGLILLFLGLQIRYVQSYTLTIESSQFLQKRFAKSQPEPQRSLTALVTASGPPVSRRQIEPPRWLGYSLLSIGAVLILHSLAMKKPDS